MVGTNWVLIVLVIPQPSANTYKMNFPYLKPWNMLRTVHRPSRGQSGTTGSHTGRGGSRGHAFAWAKAQG